MEKKDIEEETEDGEKTEEKIDPEEIIEEEDLEKLENENAEMKDQLIRLQADFVNFKKRAEKEKKATINFAIEGFVAELLPILDNFERALDSEEDKDDSFYNGVNMIYEELNKLLKNNGVEEIEAVGEKFDPSMHHAIVMEDNDEYDEGKVIEILQTGYKMKDKVIRPCMVKVSK